MRYAAEMGSGAMIYIPSLIKIGSGIQKLIGGIHRQLGDQIYLILLFQNKESRLKDSPYILANVVVSWYIFFGIVSRFFRRPARTVLSI
jgi:hypothetical protein